MEKNAIRKNARLKMEKLNKVKIVYHLNQIPRGAIILNPYSIKVVSSNDKHVIYIKRVVILTVFGIMFLNHLNFLI
ncbi:MAG: hypothetical protein LBT66_01275 [Methanobrevibacter sp.]|jgi:pre-rRNA-processing protein TSR3|nr:hypothetical protein [Candidatus Methanovirga meridionalis]